MKSKHFKDYSEKDHIINFYFSKQEDKNEYNIIENWINKKIIDDNHY